MLQMVKDSSNFLVLKNNTIVMKKIRDYITIWWEKADKQFLFWGTVAAIAIAFSIYKNQ